MPTGELMVSLVINGRKFPQIEKLADCLFTIPGMTSLTLNVNQKNTNVILGDEIIPVRGQTWYHRQNRRYQLSDFAPVLLSGEPGAD